MTRATTASTRAAEGKGLAAFPAVKPAGSGKKAALSPAAEYPERYFVRTIDAGFPPRFVPQIVELTSQQVKAARVAAAQGHGWLAQGGTVSMKRTPKNPAPGWMGKGTP